MFGRPSPAQILETILREYQELAKGDPHRLRELIPEKEIWRFFVEKRCQQHGRRLALAKAFHNADHLNLTIQDYLKLVEKLDPTKSKQTIRSALLKQIRKHYWFVKKEDWSQVTLHDLLQLDRGWIPFEISEDGYLKAMVNAFQQIFLSQQPGIDFILNLHLISLSGVSGTNYDTYKDTAGSFRILESIFFDLTKHSANKKGIKEFLDRGHPERFIKLEIYQDKNRMGVILINGNNIKSIKDFIYLEELQKQWTVVIHNKDASFRKICEADDMDDFLAYLKQTPQLFELLTKLGQAQDNDEIAAILYGLIDNPIDTVKVFYLSSQEQHEDVPRALNDGIRTYLQTYEAAIKQAATPIDKLKAIVRLVQDCELQHPFSDANGRTLCMLFINFLLIREGFPLAILNDSNHFNLYAEDDLLRGLIKGMANTLELIKKGVLFEVATDDILRQLRSKPVFKDMLQYFEEVEQIETTSRKMNPTAKIT